MKTFYNLIFDKLFRKYDLLVVSSERKENGNGEFVLKNLLNIYH